MFERDYHFFLNLYSYILKPQYTQNSAFLPVLEKITGMYGVSLCLGTRSCRVEQDKLMTSDVILTAPPIPRRFANEEEDSVEEDDGEDEMDMVNPFYILPYSILHIDIALSSGNSGKVC